ncbi:MAG: hypothetical protein ACE37D_10465 [Pseudomonadales bacterium]|jgi:dihydroorotase-like cyclic amidohydrolase
MSSPRFPDIEIYLKRVATEDVLAWLQTVFNDYEVVRTEPSTRCKLKEMFCTITENVAKGGYTSVWFESNATPWETDRDCAQAAFAHFQCETRCSTGGWEGEDEGGWLRLTDKGEQVVNWHQ